ncbi:hypothetical protein WJX79_002308 [Trebouxia sp. C0005]
MTCLPAHERWLCGTHRPCRQMHVWLQPCRRRTAAGNVRISESFSQQAFAQPHTASGVRCQATAAQPQKQQVRGAAGSNALQLAQSCRRSHHDGGIVKEVLNKAVPAEGWPPGRREGLSFYRLGKSGCHAEAPMLRL